MLRCRIYGLIFTRQLQPVGEGESWTVLDSGPVGNGAFWAKLALKEFRTKTFTNVRLPPTPATLGSSSDLRIGLPVVAAQTAPVPGRDPLRPAVQRVNRATNFADAQPQAFDVARARVDYNEVYQRILREDRPAAGVRFVVEERVQAEQGWPVDDLMPMPMMDEGEDPAAQPAAPVGGGLGDTLQDRVGSLWNMATSWTRPGFLGMPADPYSGELLPDLMEHITPPVYTPRANFAQMFWLAVEADDEDPAISEMTLCHIGGLLRGCIGGSGTDMNSRYTGVYRRNGNSSFVVMLGPSTETDPRRFLTTAINAVGVGWRSDATLLGRLRANTSDFFRYFSHASEEFGEEAAEDYDWAAYNVAHMVYRETAYAVVQRA